MSDTGTQPAEATATTPRVKRNITFIDTPMDIPPLLKESMYPWERLSEGKPLEKSFFVECESKEDAETLRSSVYGSGRTYYQKRGKSLRPVVRIMEYGEPAKYGVMAWATIDEGEEEEGTAEAQS